jgi:transcription initiation factor TFIID subunit 6
MDEQDIAESVGIPNLKDDVATSLAQDVEYRIHEIVQEAMKFMRHGKRTKLTVDDINNALRVRNVEVCDFLRLWEADTRQNRI